LNEIEVAAKDAEVQAERLRDRLQKEIVESKLEIAMCKREVSDKETEMRKVATESRTTIEELRLRLRETVGKLANRDKGLEANRQKSLDAIDAREKTGRLLEQVCTESAKLNVVSDEHSAIRQG
jgi:hypothetical protein